MYSAALLGLLGLLAAASVRAGESARRPDGARAVVILVNSASADSESVGAHYAKRRGVPEANVCRIRCTTRETISRRAFDVNIRGPLRAFLVRKGFARPLPSGGLGDLRVTYLASTYGVPVKIREDYHDAKIKDLPRQPTRQNAASVDSELALVARPPYRLAGWLANPVYRTPQAPDGYVFTSRLDGPTPAIARGLVDAALRAETRGLFGIAYIDTRGVRSSTYRLGDDWLLQARAALGAAGFFTRVDRSPMVFPPDTPMPHAAFYFGWYASRFTGPMERKDFRFAPGAVAYHLHSGSAARLRTDRIGWAGPLLSKGAAATMGAVFEPLLLGTPDIGEFARLLLAGRTFAESAHRACRYGSWMMTFIGDPLYAPFRRPPAPPPFWRELGDATRAAERGDAPAALGLCARHKSDPLFTELAADLCLRTGRDDEAVDLCRRLGRLEKDPYAVAQVSLRIGGQFAASSRSDAASRALAAYRGCLQAHGGSPYALPVYKAALTLARSQGRKDVEVGLWRRVAAEFPKRALGRLAAAVLWVRGLGKACPVPRVTVRRAIGRPKIDGRPGDAAWKRAATIRRLSFRLGRGGSAESTQVRLACDDAALYLLAEVPAASAHVPAWAAADAESFDLSLSFDCDADGSTVMTVRRRNGPATLPSGVECRVAEAGTNGDAGWCVEMRIPFAALGRKPPGRGVVWAANFVHRSTQLRFPFRSVPIYRSWARPDIDPLASDCSGLLIFR